MNNPADPSLHAQRGAGRVGSVRGANSEGSEALHFLLAFTEGIPLTPAKSDSRTITSERGSRRAQLLSGGTADAAQAPLVKIAPPNAWCGTMMGRGGGSRFARRSRVAQPGKSKRIKANQSKSKRIKPSRGQEYFPRALMRRFINDPMAMDKRQTFHTRVPSTALLDLRVFRS